MVGSGFQNIFKIPELKKRIFYTLALLVVYRIGVNVPVPGIDSAALAEIFNRFKGVLGIVDLFSGGALERFSIFALGIMPYISSSIILQLLTVVVPHLERLSKEGEQGRKKITQYTRYGTVFLSIIQGFGISYGLVQGNANAIPAAMFIPLTVITLTAGTAFIMWLGEQITERGIGNGISLIIFAGIVAELPSALAGTLELGRTGALSAAVIVLILAMAVAVIAGIVFIERSQRRITVQYPKRQVGNRMFGGENSHLPLKINVSGVIPPIFASSIILFPATAGQWFGSNEGMGWLKDISTMLSPGQPLYIMFYAMAIIFFCFFYTAIVFNSKETADNLKKSGAFIPGIRPGEQTARFINGVMTRLTLAGAIYITAVCLLPEFLILYWNVPFYFGGTSLLIIVVVVMDFMAQVQSHMMSHQYESLMKKANLKSHGRAGVLR